MLRPMRDMPVGTFGFEAIGEVEDDDWEDVVEPVLRRHPVLAEHVHRQGEEVVHRQRPR